MALTFGCDLSGSVLTWGVFQSHSRSTKVDVAEPRDETGKILAQKAYSKTTEHKMDFLVNGTVPEAGTTLSVGGETILLTDAETSYKNTEFATGTATGNKKDSATQTAYA